MAVRHRNLLLDSDVLIQILRGDERIAEQLRSAVIAGDAAAITPITVAEIHAGMRPREEHRTRALLGAFPCLAIDAATGEQAGAFVREYGKSHAVELADALVAASAVIHKRKLWTLNRKHYPMPDVVLYSPSR